MKEEISVREGEVKKKEKKRKIKELMGRDEKKGKLNERQRKTTAIEKNKIERKK